MAEDPAGSFLSAVPSGGHAALAEIRLTVSQVWSPCTIPQDLGAVTGMRPVPQPLPAPTCQPPTRHLPVLQTHLHLPTQAAGGLWVREETGGLPFVSVSCYVTQEKIICPQTLTLGFHLTHSRLQKFLQFLAPAVVVVGGGNQNGDNKLRKLVSRVYLKLGEW